MSGWASFSIRFETKERLKALKDKKGLSSLSNAIDFLLDKGKIVDTPSGKLWYYNDDLQIDLVDREDGSYEVRLNMYPLKFLINALFVEPDELNPNQVTVCLIQREKVEG